MSRKGDGHGSNDAEQQYGENGGWARDAEARAQGSSSLWTYGGVYRQPRADNLLLSALYGFDPETGERFTWDMYSAEYARRTGVPAAKAGYADSDANKKRWGA